MRERDYRALDGLLHSRIRLAVASALMELETAEFSLLRELTGATDGNLSVHLRKLEDSGYLEVRKTYAGRKPVSYYSLSSEGRTAFERYVRALAAFVAPAGAAERGAAGKEEP
ncbi:MAG: transcriptional regulator [Spirochaetales bacterium]|nr:transcriptional regulator [Spirochaetales bacterium]HOX18992.1 transcriptional regulator [Spirochaetales bacterium]